MALCKESCYSGLLGREKPVWRRRLHEFVPFDHRVSRFNLLSSSSFSLSLFIHIFQQEAKCTFLNVTVSSLKSKWVGDSEKAIKNLFSLAHKLAPTIIFIDEVDGLLHVRQTSDQSHTTSFLSEFMANWEGLNTDPTAPVVVVGATNVCFLIGLLFSLFVHPESDHTISPFHSSVQIRWIRRL